MQRPQRTSVFQMPDKGAKGSIEPLESQSMFGVYAEMLAYAILWVAMSVAVIGLAILLAHWLGPVWENLVKAGVMK